MSNRVKILLATVALIFFLVILMIVGAFFYIQTDHAKNKLLAYINEVIPGQILLKKHQISLINETLWLENLLIKDVNGNPVASAEKLFVEISLSELLKGRINIIDGKLQKPWVKFEVKPDASIGLVRTFAKPSEKPSDKERFPEKETDEKSTFNLILQKVHAEDGIFEYEQVSKNLRVKFTGIHLSGSGNLKDKTWIANLQSGKTTVATSKQDIELEKIHLNGSLHENKLELLTLSLKSRESELLMSGDVAELFSNPVMALDMDLKLALGEIQQTFSLMPEMTGNAVINGTADGPLNDPDIRITVSFDGSRLWNTEVNALEMSAHLADRVLTLKPDSHIKLNPGTIFCKGKADFKKAFPMGFLSSMTAMDSLSYDLVLTTKALNLNQFFKKDNRLEGKVDGSLSLSGNGVASENATARMNFDLSGTDMTSVPDVSTDLTATGDMKLSNGEIFIEEFSVHNGKTNLDVQGTYQILSQKIHGSLSLKDSEIGKTLAVFGIKGPRGAIDLETKVSGNLKLPLLKIFLKADNFAFQTITIGNLELDAALNEQGNLQVSRLLLNNNGSQIKGEGILKIFEKPASSESFSQDLADSGQHLSPGFVLNLINVNVQDFIKASKVTGTFEGTINIGENIKNLHASVNLQGKKLSVSNNRLGYMVIDAGLSEGLLDIKEVKLTNGRSKLIMMGTIGIWDIEKPGFSENFPLDLKLSGDKLYLANFNRRLKGTLSVNGNATGNIKNPETFLEIRGEHLSVDGTSLGDLTMNLSIQDYLAKISGALNIDFSATVNLKNKDFTTTLTFSDTDLTPFFKIANASDVNGFLSGNLQASGNMDDITSIEGDGRFSTLALFVNEKELAFAQNFSIHANDGRIAIPKFSVRLFQAGHLTIEGSAGFDGQLSVKADGDLPLDGLSMVTNAIPDIQGTVRINAQVDGTVENPDIQGEIFFNKVAFTIPELQQRLHDLNGRIVITPKAFQIEKLQGRMDTDGSFELLGKAQLDRFQIKNVNFDFFARSLPIKVPDTANIRLQSQMSLTGTRKKALLKGEIILLDGLYYKDMTINPVKGMTQKQRRISPRKPRVTHPLLKNLHLDILIKRRNPFLVDNNLAHLVIDPDLHIIGTTDQPVIQGRTSVESGTVHYKRTSFDVKKGIIDFINPYEPEPTFDIVSTAKVRHWIITLKVSGTPKDLLLTLSSQPPEEDADILSLLVLGRTTTELVKKEGGVTRSTEQMMAEMIASTFGEDIKAYTGLDIFEVETRDDEANQENSERVQVTVGKKLSDRLTVKYAIDTKEGEMVRRAISEYKFLETIFLSAFQDSTGVLGGEVQLRLEFR